MIFFVRKQQQRLQNYALEVGKRKEAFENQTQNKLDTQGVKTALENANHAYGYYLISTRNVFGKLLSIIPGTSAFHTRVACVNKIAEAENMLKEADKKLSLLKKLYDNKPNPIHRSISDPLPELPKVYPSFFTSPTRRAKDDSVLPSRFINRLNAN